jgi:hypothetical protein
MEAKADETKKKKIEIPVTYSIDPQPREQTVKATFNAVVNGELEFVAPIIEPTVTYRCTSTYLERPILASVRYQEGRLRRIIKKIPYLSRFV